MFLFQNVQTVNLVKTVWRNATQLVIAVIKSREFVKTVANQGGKATSVKAVLLKLFSAYLQFFLKDK